jgi:hypothetical protein
MRNILLVLLCPFLLTAQDTLDLPLMGLDIKMLRFGEPGHHVLLYNMHDNENTSALCGRIMVKKFGGEYIELIHNGKRNFSYAYKQDSMHIDPNRIYTDEGIREQLKKNKVTEPQYYDSIATWRDTVLQLLNLRGRGLVIALHNNTNKHYSFKSYQPGEELEKEAAALHKGVYRDPDDFYFVTDHRIMTKLAVGRYHIILQDNTNMTDDGSLSVFCARGGIDYINVEAEHGHLMRQLKMLIYVFQRMLR